MVPPGVLYIKATKLSDAGSYRYVYVYMCNNSMDKHRLELSK